VSLAEVPRPDGRGGPHAFVEDIEAPVLSELDAHHLARVLRLSVGDPLTVSDGEGRWRACRFDDRLRDDGPIHTLPVASPPVTIAFPPVKGERPEWTVQKLTEIGVERIVLLEVDRGIVRWEGERGTRHLERLRRVAREAAMQSRRVWLPVLEGPRSVRSLIEEGAALAEPTAAAGPTLSNSTIAIGPEGGWSPEELAAATVRVRLATTVLRVETAALVAAGFLTGLRARLLDGHAE
jgi:16S rRNA (uracil1498-N3)-methyltransferase